MTAGKLFTPGVPGPGRKKGVPNKTTMDVRKAISDIAEQKAPEVMGWLDRVAKSNPDRAIDLYAKLIEYHIPKLGRVEHTGPGGEVLVIEVRKFREGEKK